MKNELTHQKAEALIKTLKSRFEKNTHRHIDLKWLKIQDRLEANLEKLWSLNQMEETGGEPDVVDFDNDKNEYIFYDCSEESPKGRRSLCYDNEALDKRKEYKPKNSAVGMALEMGIELITEQQYIDYQKLNEIDIKTSSWLGTPKEIRKLGGAIFGDCRYSRVFVYHNGAESYYAARGFRGFLRV